MGFVGFIRPRFGCRQVHLGSLVSFGSVTEFVQARSGGLQDSFLCALGGVGVRWVNSGAPPNSFRHALGVAGFVRVSSGSRWFDWGSLG